jgi:hypothetical protein
MTEVMKRFFTIAIEMKEQEERELGARFLAELDALRAARDAQSPPVALAFADAAAFEEQIEASIKSFGSFACSLQVRNIILSFIARTPEGNLPSLFAEVRADIADLESKLGDAWRRENLPKQ